MFRATIVVLMLTAFADLAAKAQMPTADGVIRPGTRNALRVPLTERVRPIELALERLRWLPKLDPEPFIAVNIPMFHLRLGDSIPANGAPSFEMTSSAD